MKTINTHWAVKIVLILVLSNIVSWVGVYQLYSHRFLEINFFDVGEGEAIFIQTPNGHQILIDGGPSAVILEKLGREMPFWDRTLDLIILTHPEHDHLAGLLEILRRYQVEIILWTGIVKEGSEYEQWKKLIKEEGAKIEIAQAGERIVWESPSGKKGYIEILYPLQNLEGKKYNNSNNTSIVGILIFEKNSFLFTGDIYKSVERKLIKLYPHLRVQVLKLAHHGSKTSTSENFISQVRPRIGIISAEKDNPYGHPHQEVLSILKKYGIKIFRTDYHGDIKIFTDGENLKIHTQKPL